MWRLSHTQIQLTLLCSPSTSSPSGLPDQYRWFEQNIILWAALSMSPKGTKSQYVLVTCMERIVSIALGISKRVKPYHICPAWSQIYLVVQVQVQVDFKMTETYRTFTSPYLYAILFDSSLEAVLRYCVKAWASGGWILHTQISSVTSYGSYPTWLASNEQLLTSPSPLWICQGRWRSSGTWWDIVMLR